MKKTKNAVSLRAKKLKNGNLSLYLDIYFNGIREYDFLKLYPIEKPKTIAERTHNNDIYRLADEIRINKESQLKYSEHGLINPKIRKINFLDYCDNFLNKYPNSDKRIVKYAIEHFKKFVNSELGLKYLLPSQLTTDLIVKFKKSLDKNFNGETPYNFFTKFKKICKQANNEGILKNNPCDGVINRRKDGIKKDILFPNEIQLLVNAKCPNSEIRRAFLLCLNTGIRYVDVSSLTWGQVYESKIIIKSQKKTKEAVYIDLNHNAKRLIGSDFGDREQKIFNLPSLTGCLKTLKVWCKNAGINKNITWHSARHSFAVNLLNSNANIKTVSSLLGHAGLKHTEKYTRVVDELKLQAVNNLPNLDL